MKAKKSFLQKKKSKEELLLLARFTNNLPVVQFPGEVFSCS
jgi:hypothetical protein